MPFLCRTLFLLVLLPALQGCNNNPSQDLIFTIQKEELEKLKLQYYSDYFSFIGRDSQGIVAFAIDNNRGQDQDSWQADHFVVLYDEQKGWQKISGNGLYENKKRQLAEIPNSQFFQFQGNTNNGMTIDSRINNLRLEVSPISTIIDNQEGISRYRLGSAMGTLSWQGRIIKGRVIHEYLYLPAFNRLSRKYAGAFKDFHGFYASIEDHGDFYLHQQKGEFFSKLTGKSDGFIVHQGKAYPMRNINGEALNRTFALGLYRWPNAWRGKFDAGDNHYQYQFKLENKNNIANWFIGGFAMGIIKGEIKTGKKRLKVTGIAELIL